MNEMHLFTKAISNSNHRISRKKSLWFPNLSFGQHLRGTLTTALTLQASIEMEFSPLPKQYLNLASWYRESNCCNCTSKQVELLQNLLKNTILSPWSNQNVTIQHHGQVNSSIRIIPLAQVHRTVGQPHFFKTNSIIQVKRCGHQPCNSVMHNVSYSWTGNSLFWNYKIAINTIELEVL